MNHAVPENARIEAKFTAHGICYHHLLQWILLHSAAFVSPYPDRQVNNVYFDTHGVDAYTENITGISSRTKLRYRWYGDLTLGGRGILELKQKRNCFGWKIRYAVNTSPFEDGLSWQRIIRKLCGQLPPAGRQWLNKYPVPVLINTYHRKYFVSGDRNIRVTVDSGQEFFEQRFNSFPNFTNRACVQDMCIVEFKFDRNHPELAARIMRDIPVRRSRYSKYITGVRAITGI